MKPSLRRRLLFLLTGTVLVAWLATALFTYFDARQEIGELLDAHLAQSAGLIAAQLEHEIEHDAHDDLPRRYRHERKIAFQVWDRQGRLLLHSAQAPRTRLLEAREGFGDIVLEGHRWRSFSRWDEGHRFVVQVAEQYEVRDELAQSVAGHLLHPLYVALPVLALLIWLAVGAGLAPLAGLAREVARRAPENLAPLAASNVPQEVSPLLFALNQLFERLKLAREQERRFTADAAHELRTPLAGVKTQAQVALAAKSEAERSHALAKVLAGTDRAAHLVEQLLVLARLDPQATIAPDRQVELHALAQQAAAEIAPLAASKDIELELAPGEPVQTVGDALLLTVLLRNLLDNAVRYTPKGGWVRVTVAGSSDGPQLTVADNGPGIPEADRARVFDRFHRGLGSGEEGSGLGLSIVRRIADLHGAEIALDSGEEGRGLRVRLRFHRSPQRPAANAPPRA
ncbi:MAG: sensor histidine kinase N-terminal domain-containing protein [Betaproteobacteria bacterium]|nr:sensor histidine kinase N-terminal domain-containing protein [Betaproteobacteria bacterium]